MFLLGNKLIWFQIQFFHKISKGLFKTKVILFCQLCGQIQINYFAVLALAMGYYNFVSLLKIFLNVFKLHLETFD